MPHKKLKTEMDPHNEKPDSNYSETDNSIGDKRFPNLGMSMVSYHLHRIIGSMIKEKLKFINFIISSPDKWEVRFLFQLMTSKFMHISTISVISAPHYMKNYNLIKQKLFLKNEICPHIAKRLSEKLKKSSISTEKAMQQVFMKWRCHTQNK